MAAFTDAAGRKWTLRITMADLARLKEAGLDVAAVVNDPTKLRDLGGDFERLGRVLWEICWADHASITPEEFARGFDGPTLFEASGAIEEAIWDFSRPPQVAKKFAELRGEAIARIANEAAESLASILSGSSDKGGNLPASSESTPAPAASAN